MRVASNPSLGINPVLYKTLSYDVFRDFAPVTRGVIAPMVIVAHPGAKLKTLGDLIERGKQGPQTLFYGTAGGGSPLHLGVRMMEEATAARFSHVPYKGVGPAYTDLLGGRLQFMLTDLASVRGFIDGARVVALAVTDKSVSTTFSLNEGQRGCLTHRQTRVKCFRGADGTSVARQG